MITRDVLWKGIIEDLAEDLLCFFFPDYESVFDFSQKIEFLDKELAQLHPESYARLRHADKLLKVKLKTGETHWFLIHIEVQGYSDPFFGLRMFQSAYRILDRHQIPLTALVIYTDANREYHVNEYRLAFMGTEMIYRFNTFSLCDYLPEQLEMSDNIFAHVLMAAYIGIGYKPHDDLLAERKLRIIRRLLERGYRKEKVRKVMNFILQYVRFENRDKTINFEQVVTGITKNQGTMGIEELIIEESRKYGFQIGFEEGKQAGIQQGVQEGLQDGLQQGLQQGMQQGMIENKRTTVLNGYKEGLSIDLLARLTNLTEDEVLEIIQSQEIK